MKYIKKLNDPTQNTKKTGSSVSELNNKVSGKVVGQIQPNKQGDGANPSNISDDDLRPGGGCIPVSGMDR